jgi:membrane protease subunit HflK
LALASPVFLRIFFGRLDPISSFFAFLTDAFGIDLRGSWALAFIRRSLAPTLLALVGLAWVGSAFTLVGPAEVGVVEVFGARAGRAPVPPGLHLGWPWPIESVQRVAVDRVRSLPIGFARAKRGASMLWTAQHAEEEYKLLLGDGHELISVNAVLQFKVGDPLVYLYSCADPEDALAAVADRVMMDETVGRSLDSALSENLTELATQIEGRIQQGADELGLGLVVVDLTLLGLHPPVSVARDYQAVVGARIDRNTRVLEAQAYTNEVLPGARSQANRLESRAHADATARVALARGEAEAFSAVQKTYAAAPELFTFRRLLEAREAQLQGRSFVVIDQRFERDGGALWINGSNASNSTPLEDL